MRLECKLGIIEISNIEEIEEIINKCAIKSDNIWIGHEDFPCLSVIVKGDKAVVHYFVSDSGQVFQSVGDDDTDETTSFYTDDGIWDAPNYVVISLKLAIDCIKEFIQTTERPNCINWEEL